MNAPVVMAQFSGSPPQAIAAPKQLKVEKPQGGQAVTVHVDGHSRIDFSDVASEKLTFVRVGDRLIVLFDNQSTVTLEPVFDPSGHPLADISFEMAPDRTFSGDQFAELFPITTDQSILPAAGPGGPTAGANFSTVQVAALGNAGDALALLSGENIGSGFDPLNNQTPNSTPISGLADTANVNEDGLPGGNFSGAGAGVPRVTGSLHLDFGTDAIGRSFAFAADQPTLTALTSDGQAMHLFVTTIGGLPTMIGYVGSDPTIAANQVFTVALDANSTIEGTYTFTLLRPLDHPIVGTEDTLNLAINIIATDGSGDTAPTVIHVNVQDDTPAIVEASETHSTLTDPLSFTVATQAGSLGISWGADRFNDHVDGGVSAINGHAGDRAVVFSDALVSVTGDASTAIASLTSGGEVVHYALLNNGTVLLAYTGDVVPGLPGTGKGEGDRGPQTSPNVVFMVTLSDAGDAGSYVITQYRPLDHSAGAQTFSSIDLSFHFTATDSDGDPVSGTLTATIDDTVPTIGTPDAGATRTLEEAAATHTLTGIALGIAWGADASNGGPNGIDRSVQFAPLGGTDYVVAHDPSGQPAALFSNGVAILFTTIDGVLVGYTGTTPTLLTAPGIVFTVSLSDDGTGSYSFDLRGPLDHPAPVNGAQFIDLVVSYTATDSDHDTSLPGSFTVRVDAAGSITGAAHDTIDYSTLGHDVTVDLGAHTAAGVDLGHDALGTAIVNAIGGSGNDTFTGGSGDNVFTGGAGNDTFNYAIGGGHDTIDGGTAITGDTLVVQGDANAQSLTLTATSATGFTIDTDGITGAEITAASIEKVNIDLGGGADALAIGGAGTDDFISLAGTAASFVVDGIGPTITVAGTESITVDGNDGDDVINASALKMGTGSVTLDGGAGDDVIVGSAGNDTIRGGSGDDIIDYTIGNGHDIVDGGDNNDTLNVHGDANAQSLTLTATSATGFTIDTDGAAGAEITGSNIENVAIDQGDGADALTVNGLDTGETIALAGTAASFTVTGTNLPVTAVSNDEAITIRGNGGDDTIDASGLDSAGSPQTLAVTLDGGAGNDTITGSTGSDTIIGGAGNDIINGGQDNDTIAAGDDNDTINYTVGDGYDTVDGGAGTDTLNVAGADAAETYNINAITLNDGGTYLGVNIESGAGNNVAATATNYEIATTAVEEIVVSTGGGADTVNITGSLNGTGVATSTFHIDLGAGNDTLDLSTRASAQRVVADGGADIDTVKLDFNRADIAGGTLTKIFAADGVTLIGASFTHVVAGQTITDEYRNFENFVFKDGTTVGLPGLFNTAPAAVDDKFAATEDTPLVMPSSVLSGNDSDPDNDALTVTAVNGAAHGTVSLVNGNVTFTADANYSGVAGFDYSVSDGHGGTATGHVAVDVAPVADAPVFVIATHGTPAAAGDQFRMNTTTAGYQQFPSLAALNDGGYVATWSSAGQDGSGFGIFSQRYDSAGHPQGSEFQVNTFTSSDQIHSSVATLSNGDYVVTWTSSGEDGSGSGIYGRRFNAAGEAETGEFRINVTTSQSQTDSSIAALANGGFVVTWTSYGQDGSAEGVFARRYDAAGQPSGEFRVNSFTNDDQSLSSVAGLAGGDFVVTWTSYDQDGNGYGIYGQRYDANGVVSGGEFRINSTTAFDQIYASVAALTGGGFVVTWTSYFQDGGGFGVYGQRYDSTGAPSGTEFLVNTTTAGVQDYPSVTALADGGYLVTWESSGQDGSGYGIYGQRYGASGQPVGNEYLVNQISAGEQVQHYNWQAHTVIQLADGSVVSAWEGAPGASSTYEVFARSFSLGAAGAEDTAISLGNITAAVSDTSTSATAGGVETLRLVLSGFPSGATFSVGHAGNGADLGKWVIDDAAQIASLAGTQLTMTPPQDYNGHFTLSVSAVVTDTAMLSDGLHSNIATTTHTIDVNVTAVNDAPRDIIFHDAADAAVDPSGGTTTLSIAENSTGGTVLGKAIGVDIDTAQTLSYAFWNGTSASQTTADGRFAIDASTGVITVVNGAVLDYENSGTGHGFSYTVRTTDQSGASYDEGVKFALTDVAEAVTVRDTSDASGHYAFPTASTGTPHSFDFDYATLFTGGIGVVHYALTVVDSLYAGIVNLPPWLQQTGTHFTGTPVSDDAYNYLFQVTATDDVGSVTTYFELSALQGISVVKTVASNSAAGSLSSANGDVILVTSTNITASVNGGNGDDVMIGTAGADTLVGGRGYDVIYGLDGNDNLTGDGGTGSYVNFLDGGAGNDTLTGGGDLDFLLGGSGNDTLNGGSGSDFLLGGLGNDTLIGGAGDDHYQFNLFDGNDTITETGAVGFDKIEFLTNGGAFAALNAYDSSTATTAGNLVIEYNGQQLTINNEYTSGTGSKVEYINFSNGSYDGYQFGANDYLISLADPADVSAFRTVDLSSVYGNNFVAGENVTNDKITGSAYDDVVFGGTGDDVLNGNTGNDLLVGGAGNDTLVGGPAALTVFEVTAQGDDVELNTHFLQFRFVSGSGAMQSVAIDLRAGGTFGAFDPDGGNQYSAGSQADGDWGPIWSYIPGSSATILSGTDLFNAASGKLGNWQSGMTVFGNGSNFVAGKGVDLGIDVDSLTSNTPSNDGNADNFDDFGVSAKITLVDGRTQTVTFQAGPGGHGAVAHFEFSDNDVLDGGAGNDSLDGGGGNDILIGGLGNDLLTGGSGSDTFTFKEFGSLNKDTITDFAVGTSSSSDKIDLSALLDAVFAGHPEADVSKFVNIVATDSSHSLLQVDSSGNGGANGHAWQDVAVLNGVHATDIVNLVFEQAVHQTAVHT
jgi:T1SS-143 domain-containing protein